MRTLPVVLCRATRSGEYRIITGEGYAKLAGCCPTALDAYARSPMTGLLRTEVFLKSVIHQAASGIYANADDGDKGYLYSGLIV